VLRRVSGVLGRVSLSIGQFEGHDVGRVVVDTESV